MNRVIQISLLIMLLGLLLFDLIPNGYYDSTFLQFTIIIVIASIFTFYRKNDLGISFQKNHLKFSTLFILSFLIVHFQAYVDLLIGNLDSNNTALWVDEGSINKSAVISALALLSFCTGYKYKTVKRVNVEVNSKALIKTTILKFINSFLFFAFLLQIDSSYLDSTLYGSGGRDMSSMFGYTVLLYETSFFALIILAAYNYRRSLYKPSFYKFLKSEFITIFLLLIYVSMTLLSGDRGPVIYLTLALISSYVISRNILVSKSVLLIAILVGAFLMTFIGIIRKSDGSMKSTIELNENNRRYPKSISPVTKELAGSVMTVHISVENIPDKIPHTNGLFVLQNASVIIPGLNSTMNKILDIPSEYFSSPRLLTYLYLGKFATWGVGTSCVADTYIDFGWFGVFIIFLLFGVFIKILEVKIFTSTSVSLNLLLLYILFFSYSIYISRSNLIIPFTKLPYVFLFCYLPVFLTKRQK